MHSEAQMNHRSNKTMHCCRISCLLIDATGSNFDRCKHDLGGSRYLYYTSHSVSPPKVKYFPFKTHTRLMKLPMFQNCDQNRTKPSASQLTIQCSTVLLLHKTLCPFHYDNEAIRKSIIKQNFVLYLWSI